MIDALPLLLAPEGYQISRSVRLRSSASAYFSRTAGTPTNNTVWTVSMWVKRGLLSTNQTLIAGSTYAMMGFRGADDLLHIWNNAGAATDSPVGIRRDPSAWCHVVYSSNGTTITGYFNNAQFVSWTGTITNFNSAGTQYIGRDSSGDYFDGYLTEVNFIDGQALTPASFGETNAVTGVWQPKKYAGTYGTNGFYLNFSDNSAATAAAVGKDYSGNGNNWTPNNISVTSGVTYDSMLDVPTQWADGGNGRGNYAVLNPLDKNSGITLSNGNLDASMPTQVQNVYGTVSVTSGKWYWETTINSMSGRLVIGVGNAVDQSWNLDPASSSSLWGYYSVNGNKLNAGSSAYGNSFTTNDVIGVAVDMDSGKIWFSKNGTWQASGDPAAGINAAFTNLTGSVRPMYDQQLTNAVTISCNFGQRPFTYTPPSGFKALNTLNLPTPTILKGNQYFDATTYTGNGSTLSVTNSGAMQPDMVWIKSRSNAFNHWLTDSVRGVTKQLGPNQTIAELTASNCVTSFDARGFSIGNDAGHNTNAATYVGWQWKEGATQGFDIVTYTGNGTNNRAINHNLGVTPAFIIVKDRTNAFNWDIYHQSLGINATLIFTTAATRNVSAFGTSAPTSTVFYTQNNYTNTNSANLVAYLFAEVAGFSKFGTYTGNGSADGPFVFCGFRPRFLMLKRYDSTGDWLMLDSQRSQSNVISETLFANTAAAEASTSVIDFLSNGFKLRGLNYNASGSQFIIAAFAENPFKNALAR